MFSYKVHTDKASQHVFTRCLATVIVAAFMCGAWLTPAYGQWPEPSVRVDWIHPGEVPAGSDIPLYAIVHNQSAGDIQVLSFRTHYSRDVNYPYNDHYQFRPCRQSCSLHSTVKAGQSLIMAAGTLYADEDIIYRVPVIQNRNTMTILDMDGQPSRINLPVIDIRTVPNDLVDQPNPYLFPIPDRQRLEVRDLHESGDSLLIHDPNASLDWLRLDATLSMNLDELTAALSPGGRFGDFEVARVSQIETLMLNHLHADGIAAQKHDLHFWPSAAARPAIADLIRMIQPIQEDESFVSLSGIVADKPLILSFEEPDSFAGLHIGILSPSDYPVASGGAQVIRLPFDSLGTEELSASIWLVRGADLPEHSAVQATFIDNELWIPSVQLGDEYFSAALRLIDPELLVLVVAELISIDATSPNAYFDPVTEFIMVPDAIIYEEGHPPVAVDVTLQLIPDTNPPALQVIGMEAHGQ